MPSRQPNPEDLPDAQRIGLALKRLREERGLLQREVVEQMGKPPSSIPLIGRWERGTTAPSVTNVWQYLRAIDADFADLERALQPPPDPAARSRLQEIADQLNRLGREAVNERRHPRNDSWRGFSS